MDLQQCPFCDLAFSGIQLLADHLLVSHDRQMVGRYCFGKAGDGFDSLLVRCWCDHLFSNAVRVWGDNPQRNSEFARHLLREGGACAHYMEYAMGFKEPNHEWGRAFSSATTLGSVPYSSPPGQFMQATTRPPTYGGTP